MGSYIRAEFCEMVGLFLLNEIKKLKLFKIGEFGIFWDNGVAVIQSKSPTSAETTSKALRKMINKWAFKITVGLIQKIS